MKMEALRQRNSRGTNDMSKLLPITSTEMCVNNVLQGLNYEHCENDKRLLMSQMTALETELLNM